MDGPEGPTRTPRSRPDDSPDRRTAMMTRRHPGRPLLTNPYFVESTETPAAGSAGAPEVARDPSTRNGPPVTRCIVGSAKRPRRRERRRTRTGNAWPVAPREARIRRHVCLPKKPTRHRRDSSDRTNVSPRHPTCETRKTGEACCHTIRPPDDSDRFRGGFDLEARVAASLRASPVPFRRQAPKSLPPAPGQVPNSPESALREVHPRPTP
jgi:hypothetical protein